MWKITWKNSHKHFVMKRVDWEDKATKIMYACQNNEQDANDI